MARLLPLDDRLERDLQPHLGPGEQAVAQLYVGVSNRGVPTTVTGSGRLILTTQRLLVIHASPVRPRLKQLVAWVALDDVAGVDVRQEGVSVGFPSKGRETIVTVQTFSRRDVIVAVAGGGRARGEIDVFFAEARRLAGR